MLKYEKIEESRENHQAIQVLLKPNSLLFYSGSDRDSRDYIW